MPKKLTQDEFISKIDSIYQGKIFANNFLSTKERVNCVCKICGKEWKPYAESLLYRHKGCPICGRKKIWEHRKDRTTKEKLQDRIRKIFPSYDLSLIPSTIHSQKEKFLVKCPIHGEFETTADSLLHSHGCRKCQYEALKEQFSLPKDEMIKRASAVHNNYYDYSKVINNGTETINTIICPKHGEFTQDFSHHILRKQGCPLCHKSVLENELYNFLTIKKIEFIQGYKCAWLGLQHLDFYLPKYNIAIECQGEQHYKPIDFFGGIPCFNKQIDRDNNKFRLCKENCINLIYYTHYKNKIDNILTFGNLDILFKMIQDNYEINSI